MMNVDLENLVDHDHGVVVSTETVDNWTSVHVRKKIPFSSGRVERVD